MRSAAWRTGGATSERVGGRVEFEVLVRVSQRIMCNQRGYMGQFRVFGLEEFSPRRGVKEQVAHRERGSRGCPRVLATQQLATGNFHPRAGAFLRRAGHQLHPGDRGDRGQRLSAKAQGRDREQVVARAQLGSGVAFKGQESIVAHHAAAVIGDAYELASAALDRNHDAGGAGVERIFQQFLDHRCRPVDDLARRDLIGHLVGQYVDAAHSLLTFTKTSSEDVTARTPTSIDPRRTLLKPGCWDRLA